MKLWLTYVKAILAMLCWSVTFVWFKVAFRTYRPYEITFLRLVLASALLFLVMWLGKHAQKVTRKDYLRLMLVAFCEPFMYFIGEANGMQYVSPTLGSLIISTIPLFSAVAAWFILKERVSLYLILGLVISTTGVAIISFNSGDLTATSKGVMFLMIAVFAGVFYAITVRNLTHRYSAITIVAWQSLFGLLYFFPLFLYYDGSHFVHLQHSAMGLLTIAGMSVFASVGAFMLYTGVIRDLGVIKSNVFTNLIPVFTVILAFFILGDRLNIISTIGLGLALVGLVLSQYKDLRRLCEVAFFS
ncbi:MAG: DMT family transporter [Candidatus Cloacimonetes bacterium]|nr:DMT family transporter [Candidatus Cloacimonadota bacterium]